MFKSLNLQYPNEKKKRSSGLLSHGDIDVILFG